MAKQILSNVTVSINGVALGNSVKSIELTETSDTKETTAFGDGWTTMVAGLKSASVKIDFYQDYAASAVEATIGGLLGTLATVAIIANGGTASATNPSYTMTALVSTLSPVSGAVGDVATNSITWPVSGTVVKALA
jgi:hypothetical protein